MADKTGLANLSSRRLGRRQLIRGAALGGAGLAGAALIGCGGDDDDSTATAAPTGSGGTAAPTGTGTGTAAAPGRKLGGTLRLSHFGDPGISLSVLGPIPANGGGHRLTVGDSYVHLDGEGQLHPALWESWEYTEPTKISVKFREGITFQDDKPLTAADMQKCIEILQDAEASPRHQYRDLITNLTTIDVVSEYEAVLNLKAPDIGIVSNLAFSNGPAFPWSTAWAEEIGADAELTNPRLVGPYMVNEIIQGASFKFEKYDGYWGLPDSPPYMDGIEGQIVPQGQTRAAALEADDADIADWASTDSSFIRLMDQSGIETVLADANPSHMGINPYLPPCDDIRIRQAIAHALDREKIIEVVYGGLAEISTSIVLPNLGGLPPGEGHYPYDVQKAKDLIAATGLPTPIPLKIGLQGAPPSPGVVQQGTIWQEMLREVGFDCTIENVPDSASQSSIAGNQHIYPGTAGQRVDIYGSFALRMLPDAQFNMGRNFPEDEHMIWLAENVTEGVVIQDPEERAAKAIEILDYYQSNILGYIPIARIKSGLHARADVLEGLDHPDFLHPTGGPRLRYLSFK